MSRKNNVLCLPEPEKCWISWYSYTYEHLKIHTQLNWAGKTLITSITSATGISIFSHSTSYLLSVLPNTEISSRIRLSHLISHAKRPSNHLTILNSDKLASQKVPWYLWARLSLNHHLWYVTSGAVKRVIRLINVLEASIFMSSIQLYRNVRLLSRRKNIIEPILLICFQEQTSCFFLQIIHQ